MTDNAPPAAVIPSAPAAPEPSLLELAQQQEASEPAEKDEGTEQELSADSDDDTDDDEGTQTEQADDDDSDDDESEEVEWEGKTHKLPKGIREALLRQEDYTRKTQALADERRQAGIINKIALERAQIVDRAGTVFAHQQDAINKLAEIDQKIDFRKLEAADPNAANQWWRYREQLKEFIGRTEREIGQAKNELDAAQQQETAMRVENFHRVMSRDIKGWSGDLNGKVGTFAVKKLGFTQDEVRSIDEPRVGKALHLAYLYHEFVEKAKGKQPKQANKQPAGAQPTVQPTGKLSKGASTATKKNPYKMTDGEYFEMRKAQLNGGRRDDKGRFR